MHGVPPEFTSFPEPHVVATLGNGVFTEVVSADEAVPEAGGLLDPM